MILQQATMRLGMYQPIVAGLPIVLHMATQLQHLLMGLVAKIATGGFFTPPMLVLLGLYFSCVGISLPKCTLLVIGWI